MRSLALVVPTCAGPAAGQGCGSTDAKRSTNHDVYLSQAAPPPTCRAGPPLLRVGLLALATLLVYLLVTGG